MGNPKQLENYREIDFNDIWNNTKDKLIVLPINEVVQDDLIGRIDYSKINKLSINIDFLRLSIDNDNIVYIQSNISLDQVLKNYTFKPLLPFVNQNRKNSLQIKGLKSYRDILKVKEILSSISKKMNYQIFFSKSFNSFVEKYYLDMDELSKLGLLIKNKDVIKSNKKLSRF